MEAYTFFVNSLYVGITRTVRNLYWLETDPGQRWHDGCEDPRRGRWWLGAEKMPTTD